MSHTHGSHAYRPRLALIAAYGPEIRAFLHSGLAAELQGAYDLFLVTSHPQSRALTGLGVPPVLAMPDVAEDARLQRLATLRRRQPGRLRAAAVARVEGVVARLLGPSPAWADFLRIHRIDAVLAGTYDDARVGPALRTAVALGIRAFVVSNSWKDCRLRLACPWKLDGIGLWTPDDAEQFRRANRRLPAENVFACGSLHLAALLRSEEPQQAPTRARRRVCYAAAHPQIFPGEAAFVERLAGALAQGLAGPTPDLLIRLNPMEDGNRFGAVGAKFPFLSLQKPLWEHDPQYGWSAPLAEDAAHWKATLLSTDAAITIPSTTALEFAAFGRPVVTFGVGPASPASRAFFDEIGARARVRVANSFVEILGRLSEALAESPLEQAQRLQSVRAWLQPRLSVAMVAKAVASAIGSAPAPAGLADSLALPSRSWTRSALTR